MYFYLKWWGKSFWARKFSVYTSTKHKAEFDAFYRGVLVKSCVFKYFFLRFDYCSSRDEKLVCIEFVTRILMVWGTLNWFFFVLGLVHKVYLITLKIRLWVIAHFVLAKSDKNEREKVRKLNTVHLHLFMLWSMLQQVKQKARSS